jgi:Protease II
MAEEKTFGSTATPAMVGDYAVENFKAGLNCAESVFDALVRAGALAVPEVTVAMCTGLGGGIGLSGHTCGALLAAVIANGAVHGRPDPWAVAPEERGREISAKYYRRYNRLTHDFVARNLGLTCAEISSSFEDWHGKDRRKHCLKLIADTAVLALEYLNIPQEEAFALPYGDNIAQIE